MFTTMMIPDATEEQMGWLDELQRQAVTAETAILARRQRRQADARHLLGEPDLPVLVIHGRGDRMNTFDEARHLASHIPGARLVALESSNHILLEDEPAWPVFVREVSDFLAADRAPGPATPDLATLLSPRGLELRGRTARAAAVARLLSRV